MDIGLGTLRGWVRVQNVPNYAEGQQPVGETPRGALPVTQDLPERSELVRLGDSWGAVIPTANAFTFVAAWPTTRAELVLFNGELGGGKSYAIDRVWMTNITTMAAAQPIALLGQVVAQPLITPANTPADNAAILRWNLNGTKTGYTGKAQLALANTTMGQIANKWFGLGAGLVPAPTTNLGCMVEAFCYGRYYAPPQGAFVVAGLAGTAAGTAIIGIEWHEVRIPLF